MNPWNRGTATVWPLGPNQSPTDNFSGLSAGAAKALGVINPSPITGPFGDIIIPSWKITLASSPATGGTIQVYLLFSEDNQVWPGGLDPTSTADQSATLAGALLADSGFSAGALLYTITVQSGVTVYQPRWFSLRGLIGNVPSYCSILIWNNTNVAFAAYSADNQVANYALDTYV